jgi:16S rRNA (adenine(1408)-N(1))-methyltransferase
MRVPEGYADVVVDLGTGDGKFVLREARARPDALFVGIDAVGEAFARSAARKRLPANARFVVGDATRPPEALERRASEVYVNFPWGSLLRALAAPDPDPFARVVALLRPGGVLRTLLNLSAVADRSYAERLELPSLDDADVEGRLVPGWRAAGLDDVRWRRLAPGEDPPWRTSWGQRLVRGSGRETLLVEAVRPPS